MKTEPRVWDIWVCGVGSFRYVASEDEAERFRILKSKRHGGVGTKQDTGDTPDVMDRFRYQQEGPHLQA